MTRYQRSIKIAFDKTSGEIVEADDLFKNAKEGFLTRRKFHLNEIELFCCECGQKLEVSTSKYDRLHFKHQKNAGPCVLMDEVLSPAEIEEFSRILKSKETHRHKELKNKIGKRLLSVAGVDASSVFVDNRFIIKGEDKRRPDVYCVYKGMEIVFEIQLSQLSLRYIISRHDFYKKHGIYLIWILDNFDLHREKPTQLERDIKYLTKYENFFKLNEDAEDFQLSCEYKFPFLTEENKLLTKWKTKSVGLDGLHFDENDFQAYFYNFGDNKALQEIQQTRNTEAIQEAERLRREKLKEEERIWHENQRLKDLHDKVFTVIDRIKKLKKDKAQTFHHVSDSINKLTAEELNCFNANSKLELPDSQGNPAIHRLIEETKQDTYEFLLFILRTQCIKIDVNAISADGLSVYQHLYKSNTVAKGMIMRLVLSRGYLITTEDEAFHYSAKRDQYTDRAFLTYKLCSTASNKEYTDWICDHDTLISILESAKQNKIVGFAFTNWIAFANNAIEYYGKYWEYIEPAFKCYGLWNHLISSDKKGTFHKKLFAFYSTYPKQDYEFEKIATAFYPEIISFQKKDDVPHEFLD